MHRHLDDVPVVADRRIRPARTSGPRDRSKGRRASSRTRRGRVRALVVGESGEVLDGQGQLERIGDDLAGDAAVGGEGRAQHLVAADDLGERALEGRRRRAGPRGGRRWGCCRRGCRARAGRGTRAAAGRTRRAAGPARSPARWAGPCGAVAVGQGPLDQAGEVRDGGRLEEGAQRHLDLEERAGCGPRSWHGQQRVAAELEEVVVGADRVRRRAPRPRPRPAPPRSACAAGRSRPPSVSRRCAAGGGQGAAVDLAVGRQRQRVEHHEGRRDHVLRQPPCEPSPQLGDPWRRAARRRERTSRRRGASRRCRRRAATAASRTAGCAASAASISPSSTR